MRILIIEDEEGVVRFIKKGLREEGFNIDVAESAEEALDLIKNNNYELLIIDVLLPKMTGFDFLSFFREKNQETPVLMLTAKDSISDKRIGFQRGCDDYLTKPFHFEELLMRVHALLRRRKSIVNSFLEVGPIKLYPQKFQVYLFDEPISLTKTEFSLLRYFMINQGIVLSRTQILNHVWQYSFDIGTNVVDVTINSLRKKIHREGSAAKIVSIYGMGYILQYHV
ncbi:MAG: response regulator transcription factor [Candidatus Brocadiae bacterium]|nr:response regulator transcription factor [Candidatus Brocadiia bacterium]